MYKKAFGSCGDVHTMWMCDDSYSFYLHNTSCFFDGWIKAHPWPFICNAVVIITYLLRCLWKAVRTFIKENTFFFKKTFRRLGAAKIPALVINGLENHLNVNSGSWRKVFRAGWECDKSDSLTSVNRSARVTQKETQQSKHKRHFSHICSLAGALQM